MFQSGALPPQSENASTLGLMVSPACSKSFRRSKAIYAIVLCCISMKEEAKTGIHLCRPCMAAAARPGDIVDGYETTGTMHAAELPVMTRYLHLPIRDAKHARRDLQASYRYAPETSSILPMHILEGGVKEFCAR